MNMKKIAYISVFAGLLLTGCIAGDYGIKSAGPQEWGQEEPVVLPSLSISGVSPIDLAAVEDSVAVATFSPVTLPEGAELDKYRIVLDEAAEVPVDASMKAAKADLQAAVESLYGKQHEYLEREFSGKLRADVMVDGQASLLVSNEITVVIIPEFQELADNYYLVGTLQGQVESAPNTNGWYDSVDYMNCLLYPVGEDVYEYTSMFSDGGYAGYKIWNENDYGNWDLCYGTAVNNDNSPAGRLINTGAGSICLPTVSTDDVYTITIDMANLTYDTELYAGTVVRYGSMGLIGVDGDWNNDIPMTEVSQHNWCAKNVTIATATEFKFRADEDWADSWGNGTDVSEIHGGTADYNGGNMTIAAGTYDFYFNSLTGRFAIVVR